MKTITRRVAKFANAKKERAIRQLGNDAATIEMLAPETFSSDSGWIGNRDGVEKKAHLDREPPRVKNFIVGQ